jgi:two-component system phosphate regulon sensor histidine kinase PhoR
MKLWQKVSAISILVLLVIVIACNAILLFYARDNIVQSTVNQAENSYDNIQASFSEMMSYYLRGETNPVVIQSAAKYCFARFADSTAVLIYEGKTLYSATRISPENVLPLNKEAGRQLFSGDIDGADVLIVGKRVTVLSGEYDIYIVKDITPIFNDIKLMTWGFIAIGAISIAIGTLLIVVLVRRVSKPLSRLKETARHIAAGEYGERAKIHSKDEVGELAADINAMAAAVQTHIAELNDTAKRQRLFIGGVTHEFKTPITSMIIHTDTLLTMNLSADDTKKSLLHLNRQCKWLERLTKKLMQLITIEETVHTKKESVAELLRDVQESTAEVMKERNTPLMIDCEIDLLDVDADLMKSLLLNLVDNASKASEPGQSILLRAYENIIEVSDRGKGIEEENVARVTDVFYMADPSRSKINGGSGLGLALVKRIAEAHGAEMMIESRLHVGTTVKVIFPKGKAALTKQ